MNVPVGPYAIIGGIATSRMALLRPIAKNSPSFFPPDTINS